MVVKIKHIITADVLLAVAVAVAVAVIATDVVVIHRSRCSRYIVYVDPTLALGPSLQPIQIFWWRFLPLAPCCGNSYFSTLFWFFFFTIEKISK